MNRLFDVTTQTNDEIWKDIKDYEGIYQVSNLGRVKSCDQCIRNSRGVWHIREKILLSEEHKRKLRAANIGPLNPNYGKKLSLEHKKALSDGAKRYWKEWRESK